MNQLETQIPNKTYDNLFSENETPLSIDSLNKKIVENFDNEIYADSSNVTPILNKQIIIEKLGQFSGKRKKVQIDKLYFESDFSSTEFRTALKLLAQAISYCEEAIDEFRQENFIASDDAVHHIQALMPELFCCRNLSESFGAIINSIQNALANNRGQQLNEQKLLALKEILNIVRDQPFIKFDNALDAIMIFEDNDFIVEPAGFEFLTEFLNG